VLWEPLWIELPVDFRFFPIQSGENFVLQSDPLRLEATTGGKRGAIRAFVARAPSPAKAAPEEGKRARDEEKFVSEIRIRICLRHIETLAPVRNDAVGPPQSSSLLPALS
jgi:hypothetical protein